jgi:exodeoxyribonuclease VII small subunit
MASKKDSTSTDTSASPVARFETALNELETLVSRMERGELSLEESLASYERGIALFRECQQMLEHAEQRVRLLSDPNKPESGQDFDASKP